MAKDYGCSCESSEQRWPHVTYDLGAKAVSVATASLGPIARTRQLTPDGCPFTVMLDISEDGDIVGVEVLL